jgi:DNA (cytosine-5)-methyltransferase 1
MDSESKTVASFFSGIGGLDLGFERARFEITMQCEVDDFCNQILERHWPKTKRFGDIGGLKHDEIPASDVFMGGFPCQDVSLARMGPRAGLRGRQSGLFYKFANLIEKRLPRMVLLENVPGLLSSHEGRDFAIVIRTLADLGYGVGWRVLNSRYFGVPQSRQRVYVVGCRGDWRGPAEILLEPERSNGHVATGKSNGASAVSPFKTVLGDPVSGPVYQGIAYCLYAESARHTGTDWSRTYVTYPDGRVRRLLPNECEGIQGFPLGWTMPKNPPDDPEQLDTLRYHAIGNAVTVNVAEWLARRISKYLDSNRAAMAPPQLGDKTLETSSPSSNKTTTQVS